VVKTLDVHRSYLNSLVWDLSIYSLIWLVASGGSRFSVTIPTVDSHVPSSKYHTVVLLLSGN
jgi:hypothetical protein